MKKAVKIIESLLWESRLFIILAVIASTISSIFLIFIATYDIFSMIVDIFFKNRKQCRYF